MDKRIFINNKEHRFSASALSTILYKKEFGRDLMSDLASISKSDSKEVNEILENLDTTNLLKIAYIYESTANLVEKKDTEPFLEWASQIDDLHSLYNVVIELSIKLFSKKKQKPYYKKQKKM